MSARTPLVLAVCLGLAGSIGAMHVAGSQAQAGVVARGDSLRIEARFGTKDGPQGKSGYRERTRNGRLEQRFKVSVEDFDANAEVPVSVNGMFVGTFFTNGLGIGELQFRTVVDDPGDGVPIPEGFPRLAEGDTVEVGPFMATYRAK